MESAYSGLQDDSYVEDSQGSEKELEETSENDRLEMEKDGDLGPAEQTGQAQLNGKMSEKDDGESEQATHRDLNGIGKEKGVTFREKGANLSFKDALAGNRANVNGKRLAFVEGFEDGIIKFTKKDVEKNTMKWRLSVLGMVVGDKIPFAVMQGFVNNKWAEITKPKLILTESGVFVFKFEREEDLEWVIQRGPWLIGGTRPLVLRRWREGVKLDPSCFETTQVWAALPNLDVRFWDEEFFEKIGSALGRPIFTDKVTENQERLSFARMLVEVSAKKEFKKEVSFHGEDGEIVKQPVVYEWILDICETCRVFGHVTGDCARRQFVPFIRRPFMGAPRRNHVGKKVWVRKVPNDG